MQDKLEKAIIFATKAHSGQVDKAGMPYILHPLRVMNNVDTIEEKIVAVLHDVVEDTNVEREDLLFFLNEELVNSIYAISKIKGEDYSSYLSRVKEDKYARSVKLADLKDNMNLDRLNNIETKDVKRYIKYRKAYDYLNY